ncbi:hypothetical protein L208DRAFT_1399318 [Tricholoma matsutake]|nr:hypothetical protein L208DRAFT_1399318 [Tricholoma matsutake 945]
MSSDDSDSQSIGVTYYATHLIEFLSATRGAATVISMLNLLEGVVRCQKQLRQVWVLEIDNIVSLSRSRSFRRRR